MGCQCPSYQAGMVLNQKKESRRGEEKKITCCPSPFLFHHPHITYLLKRRRGKKRNENEQKPEAKLLVDLSSWNVLVHPETFFSAADLPITTSSLHTSSPLPADGRNGASSCRTGLVTHLFILLLFPPPNLNPPFFLGLCFAVSRARARKRITRAEPTALSPPPPPLLCWP
ncbi:hypothetical protein LX32DRAFT_1338 [Colletotrichum zoysiae]|uniref:Uncharacterized protein n=1 Tax=Colletotrichum zoysiae TaxID=1216348 RepID=A0AAD9M5L2_9PEZI|nr:hypothetical protein LX32DRAFT_1338 [Colletotrichum zoysiae]